MLVGLPELLAEGESLCTVLTAEDTKVWLAKLVLQTPCVIPVGSELGGGNGPSEQTEERRSPEKFPSLG